MNKMLFLMLLLFPVALLLNAQQRLTLSGFILDNERNPIPYANVLVEGTTIGAASNINGKFEIKSLSAGKYVLVITAVGFATEKRTIDLTKNTELIIVLKEKNVEINPVVVTGTYTNKNLLDSPVRTEVIQESNIKNSAFTRLDQALYEQPGLTIIDEPWGKGIQMQGLAPDYSLVLIDGEPLIGRNAGTLNLSRFSVSNLKQIEIVKGPSSSLYGSEALAGVINLITEAPKFPYELKLQSYYKTNNTIYILSNLLITKEKLFSSNDNLTASVYFDRLSSDGYNLRPASLSLTAPKFSNYTFSPQIKYRFNNSDLLKISSRIFIQEQNDIQQITTEGNSKLTNSLDNLTDWNNGLTFLHKFTPSFKSEIKLYFSRYLTDSKSTFQSDGNIYQQSKFDQYLYKSELKNDFILNEQNYIVAGVGYFNESVEADRIYDGEKTASLYYIYIQEEWIPSKLFDFVIGTRFDNHSDYAPRLSPKFSALIKPFDFLKIRASIGSGFKAPTLQQLYLDFSNAQVGYNVFGSSNIRESFNRLLEQGRIERILIAPENIQKIRAENSVGFNLGIEFTPFDFINTSINIFRNNVRDLIEASPIAIKTNGQSVFTYFNLNKIYTHGIETSFTLNPFEGFSFSASYQYLESADENILNQIRNGEISKTGSSGRIRLVQESEYGGLFNRSKHSGTVKIDYQNKGLGLTANLRGIIRGKYGFGDTNGNGILDDKSEYIPGYAVWNFTITQEILNYLNIQFGMENIFNKTNPEFIPSLPGRIIYGGIQFSIH